MKIASPVEIFLRFVVRTEVLTTNLSKGGLGGDPQFDPDQLYWRHIWHQIRKQQVEQKGQDLEMTQDEEDSVVVSLSSPLYRKPRFLQLWIDCDHLKITPINPESELQLENYRVEGKLLLEGIRDVQLSTEE